MHQNNALGCSNNVLFKVGFFHTILGDTSGPCILKALMNGKAAIAPQDLNCDGLIVLVEPQNDDQFHSKVMPLPLMIMNEFNA